MGVFRMATKVARTSARAGGSIARGRVPSLGIRVGVAGFGIGVGTRGISVRTPVLSQSVGLSGFTTTLKVPGVARLSVNPVRPSATAALGPLRFRASRHPGIGISTGLVSLGVTTKPLAWIDVLGIRVALPGQLPPRSRPWHEEVDDQWRPYYERRPPGISEQLYDLIQQVEYEGLSIGFSTAPKPVRPTAQLVELSRTEIRKHRKSVRRDARKTVPFKPRQQRREALEASEIVHTQWIEEEKAKRVAEREEAQASIDRAYAAWESGDPLACVLVANSVLSVSGLPGFLVSGQPDQFTLVVLAPGIDIVHPYRPSVTPSGNPTVKKRSKSDRGDVHADLVGAATVGVIRALSNVIPRSSTLSVAVTLPSDSLANAPAVAWFDQQLSSQLPTADHQFGSWISDRALRRPRPLIDLLPDAFDGDTSVPAVAVDVTSQDQLSSVVYWLELDAVLQDIQTNAKLPSRSITRKSRRTVESKPSRLQSAQKEADRKYEELERKHEELERVEQMAHLEEMRSREHLSTLDSRGRAAVEAADLEGIEQVIDELITAIPLLTGDGGYDAASVIDEVSNGIVGSGRVDLIHKLKKASKSAPVDIRQPLDKSIDRVVADLGIANQVLVYVSNNPGCRQADLAKEIAVEAFRVRTACWYLNHFRRLNREKMGNSYSLSIPE